MSETSNINLIELTTQIVSSFVTRNPVPTASIPELIRSTHATLVEISTDKPNSAPRPEPAVPVSKSITPDHLICLEDGRKLKMLKRYLRSRYDMTPEEYRARWNLPADYPMVAPNYAKIRSEKAKEIGLGRRTGTGG